MLEGSDDFFQRKTAVVSRYIPPGSGVHFASQPIGPKRAEDGICDVELIDIVPDRNDFSSAIGQGNATVRARDFPEHHHIVMEIQRARPLSGFELSS
jgi:hypothetical protein